VVNTAFELLRSEYDLGIGFGDDGERARKIILETLRLTEGVLRHPEAQVLVVALADFSVNLRVWWWTTPLRAHTLAVQDPHRG
jgi:small-conductance mechanosensitive channel